MSKKEYLGMHDGAKPQIFRFAEKLRANMTRESGIGEIRFTNEAVLNQFEFVKNTILSHLPL